jgi:hypothetical protein
MARTTIKVVIRRRPQRAGDTGCRLRARFAISAEDRKSEGDPDHRRRPDPSKAKSGVKRVAARSGHGEPDRGNRVQEWQLDAVGGREEAVPPGHADRGNDHHREHESRTDGSKQAEGDEQAAREPPPWRRAPGRVASQSPVMWANRPVERG